MENNKHYGKIAERRLPLGGGLGFSALADSEYFFFWRVGCRRYEPNSASTPIYFSFLSWNTFLYLVQCLEFCRETWGARALVDVRREQHFNRLRVSVCGCRGISSHRNSADIRQPSRVWNFRWFLLAQPWGFRWFIQPWFTPWNTCQVCRSFVAS